MHPSAEMPLIAFTLLSQLAIGLMLISPVLLWQNSSEILADRIHSQRKIALLFMAIAAVLSMIHLGIPMHSPYTILNAGSSWLSREILLVILTCAALAGSVWLGRNSSPGKAADGFFWAALFLGVLLLFAMSKVYNSAFLPGWAGAQTFFLFLATALLLGSLWLAWILGAKSSAGEDNPHIMRRLLFFALAGFIILAICAPFSVFHSNAGIDPLSASYNTETLAWWRGIQITLCGLGVIILALGLWKYLDKINSGKWLFAALFLGVCGEVAGRCAFYMAYARLGI